MTNVYPPLRTVLLAYDSHQISSDIVTCLTECGYHVISRPAQLNEAIDVVRTIKPQITLVTVRENTPDRFEPIRRILQLRTTAIIILMKEWNAQIAKEAMDAGIAGYLIEPFEKTHVRAALESSWHHFQKLVSLQDDLELRTWMQKAKGVLMKEQFITEEQAHQTILRMSQDRSVPLMEVCQSILQVKNAIRKKNINKP